MKKTNRPMMITLVLISCFVLAFIEAPAQVVSGFARPAPFEASTTPPPMRTSTIVVANQLSAPPVMDGDWSEWSTREYPARWLVFGASNWYSTQDLDASYKVGWDETNLYFAVKVKDDKYVQNASVDQMYKGDSIEILLDADLAGDFNSTALDNDDYQIGISPGRASLSGPKEAFRWYPKSQAGVLTDIQIATTGSAGVYRVEIAIPWSEIGVLSPAEGSHYGFALSVSDNDDRLRDVQQTMSSNVRKKKLVNPTTWGDLGLQ